MSFQKIQKLANRFQLKLAQQVSAQPGDVADAFPEYFVPPKNQALVDEIAKVLTAVPEDTGVIVSLIVKAGGIPWAKVELVKGGKPVEAPPVLKNLVLQKVLLKLNAGKAFKDKLKDKNLKVDTDLVVSKINF